MGKKVKPWNKIDYVVIVCPGHSGSTLLAMALNSHDDVYVFGEFASLKKRVGEIRKGDRKALCSFCGAQCGFLDRKERNQITRCYYHRYEKVSRLKQLVTHAIYVRHLSRRLGCRFIGDSSKSVTWAMFLRSNFGWAFNLRYVFLIRDPRAIVAAHLRKNEPLEIVVKKYLDVMDNLLDLKAKIDKEHSQSRSIEIRYEDLAENPKSTLSRLCDFLGLPFQKSMLEYDRQLHHIIGGNDNARSRAKIRRGQKINMKHNTQWFIDQKENFVLDESWRHELNAEQIRCIENELGKTMERLGYQPGEN